MDSPTKPKIELKNISPEVKSYIYQVITEFEPFSTPNTLVKVVAKDPLQLLSQTDEDTEVPNKQKLKKMHRICIILSEEGTEISEEALHEDIFEAIKIAKDKLVSQLTQIQDDIISSQDRHVQIKTALASGEGGGGYVH